MLRCRPLHILPEAKFVAVWIFQIREQSSRLFLYGSCRHSPSVQLARCVPDVSDSKTQACVASTRQRVVWRIGNKFEKHTENDLLVGPNFGPKFHCRPMGAKSWCVPVGARDKEMSFDIGRA